MLSCRLLLLLLLLCVSASCQMCEVCVSEGSAGWNSQLMVCNIGSRNATLMWNQDTATSNAMYVVVYRDIEVNGIPIRSEPISGEEEVFSHVIIELTPETTYQVQVCQAELDTCGNCQVDFTTLVAEEPSGPPTSLVVLASGPSTLTVEWSAPLINADVVTEYFISCAPQNDPTDLRTTTRLSIFSAPFYNLIPDTTYDCEVIARSVYGDSRPATASATTPPRETAPGLLFFVTNDVIQYVQLTERTFASFSTVLDDIMVLLDAEAVIIGVDYHFERNELYLTLTDKIQRYDVSVTETGTGTLEIALLNMNSETLYTAPSGNTLGSITIDWVYNITYWIEFEGSTTKINRMPINGIEAECAVQWTSRLVNEIAVDPVHGYMYWSVDSSGLFRASLGELQSSECISGVISEENVFSSSNLVDFVLEPDVYIYLADQQGIQFIGFDQQTNGSIAASNLAHLESYGDAIVTVFNNMLVRFCNSSTVMCDDSVVNSEYPAISDILTFRNSKQPLPAPPSHPTDVRVFTGTSTAVISWMRPSFVVGFFGDSAYDSWTYCVNYSIVDAMNETETLECTGELQTTLSSLEADTLYQFVISARGPGGERADPDIYVFRTKPVGAENAKLLVSTDLQVIEADLDGSNDDIVDASMDVSQATEESNGVAYDIRSDLYFWIIEGGQSPLYRYRTTDQDFSRLQRALDTPVSLAADWVARRLFWVQDGNSVADARQLKSASMDDVDGEVDTVARDPKITTIAVDSLNGKVFWITGKDIVMKYVNGLEQVTCVSAASEPLALALDVENKYLYYMTFDTEVNTAMLTQLSYTIEQCGMSPVTKNLPGNIVASSSRGVLTYGLGTLYLTTVSSSSQYVYVFPADFANIGNEFTLTYGQIDFKPDVVRDILVVSEILQPLPDGLTTPGISSLTVEPLTFLPRLRAAESSTSVIVIEWGESPTDVSQAIVYEVEYTLTPFGASTTTQDMLFTVGTSIRLEGQTFYTQVEVSVTPHSLWLQSGSSLIENSTFPSTPEVPGKVMNVRVYVYNPILSDDETITALIVWDALTPEEAGGVVNQYNVSIREEGTVEEIVVTQNTGNESRFIVREFGMMRSLNYPLQKNKSYQVQVFAVNDGGNGTPSDMETFSTDSVSPPQQVLVATSDGSQLHGSGIPRSYEAVSPLTVDTISRHIYWYNSTTDCVMMQSLDGTELSVFIQSPPIIVSSMAYEWHGERLYMIGRNVMTNTYELWRAPIVYSKEIERVYQISGAVQSVSHLVVDSFRQGAAYWLQVEGEGTHLMYLNLSNPLSALQLSASRMRRQASSNLTHLSISALTLDPSTGDLWVSDDIDGGIFSCDTTSASCQEVVEAARSGTSVISIGLDEGTVYWTDGSVVSSVSRVAPSSPVSSSNIFGVTALLSLSPDQQPQYISCSEGTTCLAPNLSSRDSLPPTNFTVTNTSLEVWWGLPSLEACCAAVVFSYPLVQYRYQLFDDQISGIFIELEDTHLRRDNLKPFTSYDVFLQYYNLYTLLLGNNLDITILLWLDGVMDGVMTEPGVPDPIDTQDFSATPFGVICIGVDWTDPNNIEIRGPPTDLSFFVIINGSSSDPLTVNVGKNYEILLHDYTTVEPGDIYDIEVKVSNGVFNSSGVSMGNIMSWPQAPPPVENETSNTSFTVMIALEERHMDIASLLIKATGDDGDYYSSAKNVNEVPVTIFFDLFNVSSFTEYDVRAVATYADANFTGVACRTTMYDGEVLTLTTDPGVPDVPEVLISDGIASWNPVILRSSGSVNYHLTAMTPDMMLVGEIDVSTGNVDDMIMQDLSVDDLNLQVDVEYTICVTAENEIGESDPGCVESYIHMVTPEPSSTGLPLGGYIGIGVGAVFIILVVISLIFCVFCVYKKREKQALSRLAYAYGPDLELTSVRAQRYFRTNTSRNRNMWSRDDFIATEEELAQLHQFPRQHLKLQTFLGQGEFGEVFQGTANDILGPDTGPHPVAIKTFRKGATTDERQKFLSEAALLGKFHHENIVKILAVCVDNDPVFIIMELMPASDLLKFLREARPESGPALLTREEQLHITLDVAHGCYYLEQQHFIHRDIAARNCLVSSKGADRVVKIGDFGLAKDLYSSDYYQVEGERKLPVRWMAPEALLQGRFTIESDVWAYGILLHEVMSFGDQPYPGQSNQDVLQFVTAGGRLPKPENCPHKMFRLMMQCWRKYASERPHFEEIGDTLDSILEDMHRESYCESDTDDEADTLSREGSKKFPSRTPSFKSGFQNLVRTGSKKLRNSLRRHSMLRKDEQTTHTSVSSCENLVSRDNGDSFREIGPI